MENEKVVVLQLKLSRKHCLFALAFAFLCFHPRPLGSETLRLTTYYPAPYGGYVALLTTGDNGTPAGVNTLLARDAGFVGIGTPGPVAKLDVQGGNINTSGNLLANGVLRVSGAGDSWITGRVGIGMSPAFNLDVAGDLRVSGSIYSACTRVHYSFGGNESCSGGYRVVGFYGDNSASPPVLGFVPVSGSGTGAGTYVILSQDYAGWMICCKFPG